MFNWDIVTTGAFTLGAVLLTGVIDARRRGADERRRDLDARRQEVLDVVTAAEHLHDAVRLFRSVTQFRRGFSSGIATGVDYGTRYLADDTSAPHLLAILIAASRDLFRLGGMADQTQISTGARYQEIVTPPMQRLTAAAAAVLLDQAGPLSMAAEKLMRTAGRLANNAQSGKRAYGRAESAFERARQDFQATASSERRK